MAFDIQVTNPQRHPNVVPHRIVPVKFARAVSGFADKDAPDLDDRGFVLPQDFGTALGPVVGLTQNKTIRVRVIRDRLEPTAQIFPSVDDNSVAALEHPSPGTALNPNDAGGRQGDCIFLNGTATGGTPKETKVKLHFGAADGPVLAELAVRVYPELVIRVQAHSVSINGTGSTTTLATVQNIFNRLNRVYGQAGVRFALAATLQAEAINGFARAGTITLTNVNDAQNTELQSVLRLRPAAGRLNAYFFGHYFDTVTNAQDQVLGIAFSNDSARANPANAATGFPGCQAGITVRDSNNIIESAWTAAHEIGHALQLEHYANGQQGNASSNVRQDVWAHRDVMHNFYGLITGAFPANNIFPNSTARTQVGYGSDTNGTVSTGQFFGIKKIANIRQSDQVFRLRRAVRNQTFAPI